MIILIRRQANLLGLNINRGYKICIRLRYHNNPDLFLPMEQCVDTMLHELSHIIWGDHDGNFHRLWDELRDEWETLTRKGYTGEGFLSKGERLGGGRAPPPHEMRRLARANAEKRQRQQKLSKGSGQRLGGNPLHLQGVDVRQIIADQVTRRNTINKGCASGRQDSIKLSDQAGRDSFKTKAEEDDANNRAIAQALYELMEEEEDRKLKGTFSEGPHNGGLAWDPNGGLYDPSKESQPSNLRGSHPSEEEQMKWAMQESLRSTPDLQTSAFPPHSAAALPTGQIDLGRSNSAPSPVMPDSRPTPISAVSRARTFHESEYSPVSPLVEEPEQSPPAPRQSPAKRKRPSQLRSSSSNAQSAAGPISPDSNASPLVGIDISDPFDPNARSPEQWTCGVCTCINPLQYLACDACGCERPESVGLQQRQRERRSVAAPRPPASAPPLRQNRGQSLGWFCTWCGTFMEHVYWTCSSCGKMKESS